MTHTHGKFKATVNNHRTGFTVTAFLLVIAAFWFGLNEKPKPVCHETSERAGRNNQGAVPEQP